VAFQQRRGPSGIGQATLGLGIVMALVFVYGSSLGLYEENAFYLRWGLNPALVDAALAGEAPLGPALWPFVTSLFLHGGTFHLINNLLFLVVFGSVLERHLGSVWLVVLFLATGIAGGILQVAFPYDFGPPAQLVVGASGGLFGLFGAAMGSGAVDMRQGSPQRSLMIALIVINVAIGLVAASGIMGGSLLIGWQAHLGGFLAGYPLGRMLRR